MAKRIVTKIGNVFCVEIDGKYKSFFQYVANDMSQLNSSVIRVFKKRYPMDYVPVMNDIVQDDVAFYAHTILRNGIVYDAWYKVGKAEVLNEGEINDVVWGHTQDFVFISVTEMPEINPLDNWFIWTINTPHIGVGKLPEKYHKTLELADVFPYTYIVNRIKYGYYKNTSDEYSVLKRIPHSDVDSFTKREDGDSVVYTHFYGEYAVREITILGDDITKLSKDTPNANGKTLRKARFYETNWKYDEFISEEEFEEVWNK